MLTNNGWVDGNGLNPGGGFGKPGGGRVTRGGGDGLEGLGGQLSMDHDKAALTSDIIVCLIEDEDFVKRLSNHYKKPTEFEIQEMVNILVSGEA
ncbi:hypothetical protein Tco_1017161 [Tanacetum coccineum]|uniref:Uncharacterized protein n=1 Tax=Tanacetum coccineum TaxID=301880 RepID=A0ABQ5FQP1_9ASTR